MVVNELHGRQIPNAIVRPPLIVLSSPGFNHALRGRPRDEEALKDEQIKKLKQKIGDVAMDSDILREALKPYHLDRKTSDA